MLMHVTVKHVFSVSSNNVPLHQICLHLNHSIITQEVNTEYNTEHLFISADKTQLKNEKLAGTAVMIYINNDLTVKLFRQTRN